jgi:S1-C subfamily serine protease
VERALEETEGRRAARWPLVVGAVLFALGGVVLVAGLFGSGKPAFVEARRNDLQAELDDARSRLARLEARKKGIESEIMAEAGRVSEYAEAEARLRKELAETKLLRERLKAMAREYVRADSGREEVEGRLRAAEARATGVAAIQRSEKAVVVIRTNIGAGSGFIAEPRGTVATSYHVVEASSSLEIELQKRDSTEKVEIGDARVVAVDAERDLAPIGLPPPPPAVAVEGGYPYLPLRTGAAVAAGESVTAIGNPGAGDRLLDYTVTKGIVSNPRRKAGKMTLIQTSAPVNSGNSGGPLLDRDGRVIGVVALKGVDVEAVAFAVASGAVADILDRRREEPFAVTGTLEDWERHNRPVTSLYRRGRSYQKELAVSLPAEVDRMILSPDGPNRKAL